MEMAINVNARSPLETSRGVKRVFIIIFRFGVTRSHILATDGFLVPFLVINLLKIYHIEAWEGPFEAIARYGHAGISMALFWQS